MPVKRPVLAVVIPCYNEEEGIAETIGAVVAEVDALVKKAAIAPGSYVCLVNDGSKDDTWRVMNDEQKKHPARLRLVGLSRNYGHQAALMAGLSFVRDKCDCSISVDADLQDDITKFGEFVGLYTAGCEVVYGVRKERTTDTFFKRTTAAMFYQLQAKMGLNIIKNHADYRLLGKTALEALTKYTEVNLYLRGIIPQLGYRSGIVYYDRNERNAGTTKYPFKKMLSFALDGISSFSILPMRMLFFAGVALSSFSFLAILWIFVEKYILRDTITGWSSLMVAVFFLGGVQLLGLGILGEYIGKTYIEVKRRPRYFIEHTVVGKKPGKAK